MLFSNNFRKIQIYRKRYLKHDLIASIVVFLVAIPLCLGIALASGAPLFSGIISGIIGGIVVGIFSGSQVSVSGPAAGMAAVVLAAISQLGSFESFLLSLTLAGLIQIIIGTLKAGFVADYVPSNVVQGLLCAIGILLITKQLPLAFTLSTTLKDLKLHLLQTSESLTFNPLYDLLRHINIGAAIISIISLSLLIYFDKTKIKWLKSFPSPILVVLLGVVLNEIFIVLHSPLTQKNLHLVHIPASALNNFHNLFKHPNWHSFADLKIYLYAVIIAIVASLETLLNIKAGERLDKKHRYSSKNQELCAQGIGNFIAGLIGGIPITSVIVRTSLNIQAGSRTKLSAILHGVFILFSVFLISQWLNKIPLSSLACILIFTGYKLTTPAIYKNIYQQGWDRFIPFAATIFSIVVFNLLAGILIGLAIAIFYILKTNSQARLDIIKEIYPTGEVHRLLLPQQISFLNKASLLAELNTIPPKSNLIIDARYSTYIDKEIIELIKEFKKEQAPLKKLSINLIGFKDNYDIHNYIDFIPVTTYAAQTALEPYQILNLLREGNQRFLKNIPLHRNPKIDIKFTAKTQHPMAVVLGCIDSRVPVETIFDVGFGDLFCIRIAGNVINDDILASMEYACNVIGAKLIVILGHTRCGAIQAACDGVEKGHITQLLNKIEPAIAYGKLEYPAAQHNNLNFYNKVAQLNIAHTITEIYKKSPILSQMLQNDSVSIVGALYNVESGVVNFNDYSKPINHFSKNKKITLSEKLTNLLKLAQLIPNPIK